MQNCDQSKLCTYLRHESHSKSHESAITHSEHNQIVIRVQSDELAVTALLEHVGRPEDRGSVVVIAVVLVAGAASVVIGIVGTAARLGRRPAGRRRSACSMRFCCALANTSAGGALGVLITSPGTLFAAGQAAR